MLVDLIVRPPETCIVIQKKDGTAIITIPVETLVRAYCDHVASEICRGRKLEGVLQ